MRAAALALLAFLSLAGSACSWGQNEDLKIAVEQALLPGMDRQSCEWGASSFEAEPKSWYGCWDYVRGDEASVAESVSSQLADNGFDVTEETGTRTVELTAVRGSDTVCVDVLAPGFERGRNTLAREVNPDAGEVFVDVWTVERRNARSKRCAELPGWEGDSPASGKPSDASGSPTVPAAVPWKTNMSAACSDLGAAVLHLDPPADRAGLERYLRRVLALELAFDGRAETFEPAPMDAPEARRAASLRKQWERALARLALAAAEGDDKRALAAADRAQTLARKANVSFEALGLTQCLLPETGIPG